MSTDTDAAVNSPEERRGDHRGLSRRTLVLGAAWSVPVVAATVATPLAAASANAAIALATPAVVGSCGVYDDVVITVTDSGLPVANTPVTVTTTAPLELPNGTSTQTFTTNAFGQVTIPDLVAPADAGTYPITATATALNVNTAGAVRATNSNVFTSIAPGAFTALAGVDDPVQVDVAAGVYLVRDASGVIYRTVAGLNQPLTAIPGVTGAVDFASYTLDGNFVGALGANGVAYTSYNGSSFVAVPGSSTIQQLDVGAGYYVGRDAAGVIYRSAATLPPATPTAWAAISAPVAMADFTVYDGSANFIAALGTNGTAYRSVSGGAFTPITGASNLTDIQVGVGYYTARGTNGVIYRAEYSAGNWVPIANPGGVTAVDYTTYLADGNWVLMEGSDGRAYGSYAGGAFGLIPGSIGSIAQVGVGAGYWVARDAAGVVYRSVASVIPTSSLAWTAIPGLTGATDFATYEIGSAYVAAIGPSQLVC